MTPLLPSSVLWILAANDVLFEVTVPAGFGPARLCSIQDVNGDQRGDFAVSSSGAFPREVQLRSGLDGTLIRTLSDSDIEFGRCLSDVGDVDGDGSGDLVVGLTDSARVYSGSTGATLLQLTPAVIGENFGCAVAGVGDVDADGVPDIAVGVPQRRVIAVGGHVMIFTSGPGFVEVRSGANGTTVHVLQSSVSGVAFGGSICSAGDVDGDGVGDIAVAGFLEPYPFGSLSTALFSGATGLTLWEVPGLSGNLARLGDVDFDGRDDLLVGDLFGFRVLAVSGASGAILWTRQAPLEQFQGADRFGTSVAAIGDVDGDGVADGIAGAMQPMVGSGPFTLEVGPGYSHVLSGINGSDVSVLVGRSVNALFGAAVASIEDIDQDGRRELLVAEPGSNRVKVFSGDMRNSSPQSYCPATVNSSGSGARMGWSGSVGIGANDLVLTVENVLPGRTGILFASASASARRLVPWNSTYPNGFECLGSSPHFRVGPALQADAAGRLQVPFDAQQPPSGPGSVVPGSTWNFQLVYRDPLGFGNRTNRSDALAVTFRP